MSWNVWNRPWGSCMVDMGISSNIMNSPPPKCYTTFWDMTIYNDTLNWSDITPICELITELDFNTDFDLITEFGGFHRTLQRVRLANRGRLLLLTPGPVPFGTCICSNVRPFFPKLVMSTDILSFEHPSVLLFCLQLVLISFNGYFHYKQNSFKTQYIIIYKVPPAWSPKLTLFNAFLSLDTYITF